MSSSYKPGTFDRADTLIIKVSNGQEIRRIPILNEDLTFDDLVLMLQRVFKGRISTEIILKYKDEEGDLITLTDNNDLSYAKQSSRLLRLFVYGNNFNHTPSTEDYNAIRQDLQKVGEAVNQLLEKLNCVFQKSSGETKKEVSPSSSTANVSTSSSEEKLKQLPTDTKSFDPFVTSPPPAKAPVETVDTARPATSNLPTTTTPVLQGAFQPHPIVSTAAPPLVSSTDTYAFKNIAPFTHARPSGPVAEGGPKPSGPAQYQQYPLAQQHPQQSQQQQSYPIMAMANLGPPGTAPPRAGWELQPNQVNQGNYHLGPVHPQQQQLPTTYRPTNVYLPQGDQRSL